MSTATRIVRLLVHSADRDLRLFPDAHSYEMPLAHDVRDIMSAQLVDACFSFSQYTVTEYNNTLNVQLGNSATQAVAIPVGDYVTVAALAAAVDTSLEAQGLGDITCSAEGTTQRLRFQSSVSPFQVSGNAQCRRLLGWSLGSSQLVGGVHRLEGSRRVDLLSHAQTIVLNIPDFEVTVSNRDALHGSFALLKNPGLRDPPSVQFSAVEPPVKRFLPALWNLRRLVVRLTDVDGLPYNARGLDHWFALDLEVLCRRVL
jgi:hypothetical protein